MGWIDRWDIALLLVSAYVAVMAMVRLMARRRDQDVAEVERQLESLRKPIAAPTSGSKDRDAA